MMKALGPLIVPVPGTPVAAQTLLRQPTQTQMIHGVMFEVLPGNTGKVYIGTSEMNKTTLANCFAWLGVPTDTQSPTFSAALTIAPNGLRVNDYFIDADVADDGVLVTILVT